MRILVFTEGTIIMHASGIGCSREEIVRQVKTDPSVGDWMSYVPVGGAVDKLRAWRCQGAGIVYLTSRTKTDELESIRSVLKKYAFPEGELLFRQAGEQYSDIAERAMPDILIEDDCESIGGEVEMTYPQINPELRKRIQSIVVKEFGGIDHLSDDIADLLSTLV